MAAGLPGEHSTSVSGRCAPPTLRKRAGWRGVALSAIYKPVAEASFLPSYPGGDDNSGVAQPIIATVFALDQRQSGGAQYRCSIQSRLGKRFHLCRIRFCISQMRGLNSQK